LFYILNTIKITIVSLKCNKIMQHNISKVTKTILIIELCLAFYMIIVLFSSLYDDYQVESYITEFDQKNQEIKAENEKLKDELEYFRSPQYQDKIAKQNFGLVNPGEEVLILPHPDDSQNLNLEEQQLSKKLVYYENLPTYKKWWYLVFHK